MGERQKSGSRVLQAATMLHTLRPPVQQHIMRKVNTNSMIKTEQNAEAPENR